jgi:hypothetical protein
MLLTFVKVCVAASRVSMEGRINSVAVFVFSIDRLSPFGLGRLLSEI